MNDKVCKYCGDIFISTHGNDGYCSEECEKEARKLRNHLRYNSISSLFPVMLANHKLLEGYFEAKRFDFSGEELENDGLNFSIYRKLYPEPNNLDLIRLDFGTYYLETNKNSQTFKLYKNETTIS